MRTFDLVEGVTLHTAAGQSVTTAKLIVPQSSVSYSLRVDLTVTELFPAPPYPDLRRVWKLTPPATLPDWGPASVGVIAIQQAQTSGAEVTCCVNTLNVELPTCAPARTDGAVYDETPATPSGGGVSIPTCEPQA